MRMNKTQSLGFPCLSIEEPFPCLAWHGSSAFLDGSIVKLTGAFRLYVQPSGATLRIEDWRNFRRL
jgi:hypothetical protein